MRAARLVAMLLLLQARGRVTAAEVAAELEVSVATARRDLEALSTAGVPVYPQPGRGGGWSLISGARTDLTGLTATEAQALFLLTGPSAAAAPAVRSALRKLIRALPYTFRADAQAAADAVVVDATRWGQHDRGRPELVDVWYLVAGTAKGQRTFRVDRIAEATLTQLAAQRPADFELSREWVRIVDEVEQRRSLLSATVLIRARLLPVLRGQFGRHCKPLDTLDDGRVRVRVAAPMAVSIAEQLAGWGATVEVLEPQSVRTELARLGSELVARYGHT